MREKLRLRVDWAELREVEQVSDWTFRKQKLTERLPKERKSSSKGAKEQESSSKVPESPEPRKRTGQNHPGSHNPGEIYPASAEPPADSQTSCLQRYGASA